MLIEEEIKKVKEVVHRSTLIGFSNQEIRTLKDANNEINRKVN